MLLPEPLPGTLLVAPSSSPSLPTSHLVLFLDSLTFVYYATPWLLPPPVSSKPILTCGVVHDEALETELELHIFFFLAATCP